MRTVINLRVNPYLLPSPRSFLSYGHTFIKHLTLSVDSEAFDHSLNNSGNRIIGSGTITKRIGYDYTYDGRYRVIVVGPDTEAFEMTWKPRFELGRIIKIYADVDETIVALDYRRLRERTSTLSFLLDRVEIFDHTCNLREVFFCQQTTFRKISDAGPIKLTGQYVCYYYGFREEPVRYKYTVTPAVNTTTEVVDKRASMKVFSPESSNHHDTTIAVIAFFVGLMLVQNILFPVIVFTLLN